MRFRFTLCVVLGVLCQAAAACPVDAAPRAPGVLLSVQGGQDAGGAPLMLDERALAALPQANLTQRLSVAGGSGGASAERSTVHAGVLLRDLLVHAGLAATDRGARTAVIEAVATDGYRAVFSWGELFNAPAGEHVIVIRAQDGRALDTAAGPLALRSLDDLRPGPRHVRNLCALAVRR